MQGAVYLDLLDHFMKSKAFESPQRNKLVYPVHDSPHVADVAPEGTRNDLCNHGTTKRRYIACRAGQICEALLLSLMFIVSNIGLVTDVSLGCDDLQRVDWWILLLPPFGLG